MRRALYAGAGVLVVAAVLLAVLPFGLGKDPSSGLGVPVPEELLDTLRCSAPVRQVVALPEPARSLVGPPNNKHIVKTDVQPACKATGRARLATSGALLLAAGLALALARRTPAADVAPRSEPAGATGA